MKPCKRLTFHVYSGEGPARFESWHTSFERAADAARRESVRLGAAHVVRVPLRGFTTAEDEPIVRFRAGAPVDVEGGRP